MLFLCLANANFLHYYDQANTICLIIVVVRKIPEKLERNQATV
jgi:hypothetical protein